MKLEVFVGARRYGFNRPWRLAALPLGVAASNILRQTCRAVATRTGRRSPLPHTREDTSILPAHTPVRAACTDRPLALPSVG
ncbi:hypothetical protein RRG08_051755 [Elysia crispata]|uniref:Uncharacterized protein n=1 Tax=Elysia crispata TaxID=231223 RepID=A0AAE1EC22_9GAST|nr:hypothetical protein RRG08_051755 [Elysia crispata]